MRVEEEVVGRREREAGEVAEAIFREKSREKAHERERERERAMGIWVYEYMWRVKIDGIVVLCAEFSDYFLSIEERLKMFDAFCAL